MLKCDRRCATQHCSDCAPANLSRHVSSFRIKVPQLGADLDHGSFPEPGRGSVSGFSPARLCSVVGTAQIPERVH